MVRTSEGGLTTVRHVIDGCARLITALDENDSPLHALASDENGQPHGLEREWHPSGRLGYEARYEHGLQHGLQRQWDERGRLVVRTRFVRGTGLDLYCGDLRPGVVSESRELAAGLCHGFERWWTDRKLTREAHFVDSWEHGVTRSWTLAGKMERGWPRYFVRGERVDRRAYLRACKSDETLPHWRARDDRPTRPRPVAISGRSRKE